MFAGQTIQCFASGYDTPATSKHHVMHGTADRGQVASEPRVTKSDQFACSTVAAQNEESPFGDRTARGK